MAASKLPELFVRASETSTLMRVQSTKQHFMQRYLWEARYKLEVIELPVVRENTWLVRIVPSVGSRGLVRLGFPHITSRTTTCASLRDSARFCSQQSSRPE